MKNHFIAANSITVMSVEHRLVLVGIEPPALGLFCAQKLAQFAELPARPTCSFTLHGIQQRAITQKQVVIREWRDLIGDFVSASHSLGRGIHSDMLRPYVNSTVQRVTAKKPTWGKLARKGDFIVSQLFCLGE